MTRGEFKSHSSGFWTCSTIWDSYTILVKSVTFSNEYYRLLYCFFSRLSHCYTIHTVVSVCLFQMVLPETYLYLAAVLNAMGYQEEQSTWNVSRATNFTFYRKLDLSWAIYALLYDIPHFPSSCSCFAVVWILFSLASCSTLLSHVVLWLPYTCSYLSQTNSVLTHVCFMILHHSPFFNLFASLFVTNFAYLLFSIVWIRKDRKVISDCSVLADTHWLFIS